MVGNHVNVADWKTGLQILEMRLGYPQTLERRLFDEVPFQPLAVNSLDVVKSGLLVAI